jgi:dolichol-phosphate mannosyltransferase/undecaprenyl-phosphate 4-deoxy-4-formamido-L-arabinose transferase
MIVRNRTIDKPPSATETTVRFSVVVPVFNSKPSLAELLDRLAAVFRDRLSASYEVILVDDASTDPETWPTVAALARARPHVCALQLVRNSGRPAAVLAGMTEARGEFVITMDDDLQHLPEDLPLLVGESGHDAVIARFPVRHDVLLVRFGSWLKRHLDRFAGMPPHVTMSSYLLLRRQVVESMGAIRMADPSLPALLFHVTRDAVNVDVGHAPRRYGPSTFTWRRRLRLFLDLAFHNAWVPLHVASALGVVIAGGSFLLGAYLMSRHWWRNTIVPGWTSVMLVTLFLGGCILATLSLIGRALLALMRTVEARPAACIRQRIDGGWGAQ